jgi:hypothetical protein
MGLSLLYLKITNQGARSVVWSFQIDAEQRRVVVF